MKKETSAATAKPRRKRWTRDDTELTLLGLPAMVWYAVFCYLPMFGLIIAFKNFKITPGKSFLYSLFHSDWVGFDNFKFFLTSNTFTMLLRNTLLYNLLFIVLNIVIPVALAVIINQIYSRVASKAYQTMMFFPRDKIMWYSQPKYWPVILTFMQVWKTMGYSMVVYLASITGIDSTLYEAATLDGATKWQQTKYITIPSLKPIIVMMFILNIGRIFYSDFGLFYQVTQGVPNSLYNVASTFDTYVYQALQSNVTIGKTAAAGLFQAVCCCFTVLAANFIVSKIDEDSAII